jgi:hypothetical protein
MSAPLPPAVSAALADLEAATDSARPHKWLALARAWTEAAATAGARGNDNDDANANANAAHPTAPDATECHERAYTACATGLRELLQGQPGANAQEDEALSSGRMQALAALAAVPPSAPAPLTPPSSPSIKRVYVVSDLHVDQPLPWRCGCLSTTSPKTGMDWLRGGGIVGDPEHGCLVVAGDCADSLTATLSCLAELKQRFARVFYCPGNHELYLRGTDAATFPDSWCKLFALRRACARLGVETEPAAVAAPTEGGGAAVVIAPLLSWYDDGAFCGGSSSSSLSSVRYDAPCAWGPVREQDVHRVMLSLAKRSLATAARAAAAAAALASVSSPASSTPANRDVALVTATHFLPRRELPFHGGLMDRAMGCAVLGEAVLPALAGAVFGSGGGERLHIHAYGHSHVHCDRDDLGGDGVRYVQRALGAGPTGASASASAASASASASASACRCFQPLLVWEAPLS